jgi:phage-related protein
VIEFPLVLWNFFDYVEGNRNAIEEWLQGLSLEGKELFKQVLKTNAKADLPQEWGMKPMKGELKKQGIWEWRFFADRRQQRVLGVFGYKRKEAIFLIACYHKQGNYTPTKSLDTAVKRAKEVYARRALLSERPIPED